MICRMTTDLDKLQGVLEAIGVVGRPPNRPRRAFAAGAGSGLPRFGKRRRRSMINSVVTSSWSRALLDPRPAYAAADIVIGMGSSASKGMAFGKPLVVQGEQGFWKLLEPATLPIFLAQGFWPRWHPGPSTRGTDPGYLEPGMAGRTRPVCAASRCRQVQSLPRHRCAVRHLSGCHRHPAVPTGNRHRAGSHVGRTREVQVFSMARQRARRHLQVS